MNNERYAEAERKEFKALADYIWNLLSMIDAGEITEAEAMQEVEKWKAGDTE